MNFQEAVQKLNKIANGKYNSLSYEVTQFSKYGSLKQRCTVYIDGYNHTSGSTWEKAFEKLNNKMNPPKMTIDDIDPVPEIKAFATTMQTILEKS